MVELLLTGAPNKKENWQKLLEKTWVIHLMTNAYRMLPISTYPKMLRHDERVTMVTVIVHYCCCMGGANLEIIVIHLVRKLRRKAGVLGLLQ